MNVNKKQEMIEYSTFCRRNTHLHTDVQHLHVNSKTKRMRVLVGIVTPTGYIP